VPDTPYIYRNMVTVQVLRGGKGVLLRIITTGLDPHEGSQTALNLSNDECHQLIDDLADALG
jgi:hypothetical protein